MWCTVMLTRLRSSLRARYGQKSRLITSAISTPIRIATVRFHASA